MRRQFHPMPASAAPHAVSAALPLPRRRGLHARKPNIDQVDSALALACIDARPLAERIAATATRSSPRRLAIDSLIHFLRDRQLVPLIRIIRQAVFGWEPAPTRPAEWPDWL